VREARRERPVNKGSGGVAAAAFDGTSRELWERLRAWRAATAKEHGVPAYVVFHDATLAELVRERPATKAALARISGVGAQKLERYGAELLEFFRA
jgi:ATP-dependent DNA helicase RecQ